MIRKACFIYLGESIVTQYQLAATGGAIAWGRDGTVIPQVLCLAGCGSDDDEWTEKRQKVYPAGGVVMFNGAPLEGATVQYISPSLDLAAGGTTDAKGHYQLQTYKNNDGAAEGAHKVVVTKRTYEEKPTKYNTPDEPSVALIPKELLPKKYSNAATTDIEVSVSAKGPNEATIELKGK